MKDYLEKYSAAVQKEAVTLSSVEIHNFLDVAEVLPHLRAKELLSDEEFDILSSPYLTRKYKIDTLLKGLPLKGSDFLEIFLQCLHSTVDGTGHKKLMESILFYAFIANGIAKFEGEHHY